MKQDKDKRGKWHVMLSITVAVVALALSGCTKEPLHPNEFKGDVMQVRISLPDSDAAKFGSRAKEPEIGLDSENKIAEIAIFVFNASTEVLESMIYIDDLTSTNLETTQPKWKTDQILMVPITTSKERRNIYAVANYGSFNSARPGEYTETRLKSVISTISGLGAIQYSTTIEMSGKKMNVDLNAQAYSITINIERYLAKIRANITISTASQSDNPDIEWSVGDMKIIVENTPATGYLVAREPAPYTYAYLPFEKIYLRTDDDIRPGASDQKFPPTKDLVWKKNKIYVFENYIEGSNTEKATYIVIQLPYKNLSTGIREEDNYYKLYINDKDNPLSPHSVLHNTIYDFKINILGLGSPFTDIVTDVNVDTKMSVVDWEYGGIGDVEVPQDYYFNVDLRYLGFQSFETKFQSTIATNVADWKLVKADGTTILSFAEGKSAPVTIDKITYAVSGNASVATITVSREASAIDFPTQKMFFVAKNLKTPFTVAYDNGFIPNSVLTQGFTAVGGVYYMGWPGTAMPKRGLQIAKRGNMGVPTKDDDDLLKSWKTTQTATSGANMDGLGVGASNTVAMAGAEHPAAQYCRDMGAGWFLPSKAELALIHANLSKLGPSYKFVDDFYWSSTDNDAKNACPVDLSSGDLHTYDKRSPCRIRCVKAI